MIISINWGQVTCPECGEMYDAITENDSDALWLEDVLHCPCCEHEIAVTLKVDNAPPIPDE